jgi:hypothetical protein
MHPIAHLSGNLEEPLVIHQFLRNHSIIKSPHPIRSLELEAANCGGYPLAHSTHDICPRPPTYMDTNNVARSGCKGVAN